VVGKKGQTERENKKLVLYSLLRWLVEAQATTRLKIGTVFFSARVERFCKNRSVPDGGHAKNSEFLSHGNHAEGGT